MNDIVEKTEGTAGEIVLYQPDEMVNIEVILDVEHNTVWLTQAQMAVGQFCQRYGPRPDHNHPY